MEYSLKGEDYFVIPIQFSFNLNIDNSIQIQNSSERWQILFLLDSAIDGIIFQRPDNFGSALMWHFFL